MKGVSNYYYEGLTDKNTASRLTADPVPAAHYQAAHEGLVIPCHDVFIEIDERILLVHRDNAPAEGLHWPIGGRILRGMGAEDSLKSVVTRECGLALENIQFLGTARTYFATEPFGHGRGTDTLNLVYTAQGKGELKLDDLHSKPVWIHKSELHDFSKGGPYVRDYLKMISTLL